MASAATLFTSVAFETHCTMLTLLPLSYYHSLVHSLDRALYIYIYIYNIIYIYIYINIHIYIICIYLIAYH